jgi:hypothetical protein
MGKKNKIKKKNKGDKINLLFQIKYSRAFSWITCLLCFFEVKLFMGGF